MAFGLLKAQTQDTASVIFQYLPESVRIDTTYILLAESPSLAYKVTWKNLQRSMNFSKLVHTETSYPDDYFALTHSSGGLDTVKGIKASDLYYTLFKDSVTTSLGTATSAIYGYVDSTANSLTSDIGLKTNITTTDSVKGRLTTAEGSIISHTAYIDTLLGNYSYMQSVINLKASITTVDSLDEEVQSAAAGVVLNANAITSLDSSLTVTNSYFFIYAKKDSMISYINGTPESIKISADKIILDGSVIADSLAGKVITGATIQTATSGQRVVISDANVIYLYNGAGDNVSLYGSSTYSGQAELLITGYVNITYDADVQGSLKAATSKFIVNNAGQITKINNVVTSGYIPISNGTHYEPRALTTSDLPLSSDFAWTGTHTSTKTANSSYYYTIDNQSNGTSAVSGFYAKSYQGGSQVGVALQAFNSNYSDAGYAGYARIAADAALNGLIVGAGSGKEITFRINNLQSAKVTSNGLTATKFYVSAINTAPASAGATGTAGEIRFATDHIYVCTSTNTWKRVAVATW